VVIECSTSWNTPLLSIISINIEINRNKNKTERMKHIPTFENFVYEANTITGAQLEMRGPGVEEILDAINRLNGAQLSGPAFEWRDHVHLSPVDRGGHVISRNESRVEIIVGLKSRPAPDLQDYLDSANRFLKRHGFKCILAQA